MQFYYATLLFSGLAFGSKQLKNTNTTAKSCNSQNNGYAIGMNVDAIETANKRDHRRKTYKICPKDSTKCGVDGVYFDCINDKWVKNHCKCPKMQCRKTGMFNDCIDVGKKA